MGRIAVFCQFPLPFTSKASLSGQLFGECGKRVKNTLASPCQGLYCPSSSLSALPGSHEVGVSATLCSPHHDALPHHRPVFKPSKHGRPQKVSQNKSFLILFDVLSPQLPQLSNMQSTRVVSDETHYCKCTRRYALPRES